VTSFVHCRGCGTEIHETAPTCPKCGAPQNIGNASGGAAQPMRGSNTERKVKVAKSAETEPLDIDYSEIPFYRRRWFYLITLLLFVPLTALIAMTGPLYYQQKGEVKKLPASARVTFVIIGVFATIWFLLRGVAMLGVSGVGSHACADDATTGLVKEIFLKDLNKGMAAYGPEAENLALIKMLDIKVTGVRTNGTQKGKSKLSCTANLEITIPADSIKAVTDPTMNSSALSEKVLKSMGVEGNVARDEIQYTSQLADNGTELFVELNASDNLKGILALIANSELRSKIEQRNNPAVANSSVAPPPAPAESVINAPVNVESGEAVVKAAAANLETKSAVSVLLDEKDSPPIVANLCAGSETVLFACSTGKKLISVCGTKALSANSGQILYRLAPIGKAPEMTYPEGDQPPRTAFKQGSFRITDDRSGSFLSFSRGDFRYVVYSGEGKAQNYSGVAVERAGKRIASLRCEGDVNDNLYRETFSKLGVATDSAIFEPQ
jgi:hypothetical protein